MLVSLDGLPGMDGIEAIGHLKRSSPNAVIIVLTVMDDGDKILSAICAGTIGYLLKTGVPMTSKGACCLCFPNSRHRGTTSNRIWNQVFRRERSRFCSGWPKEIPKKKSRCISTLVFTPSSLTCETSIANCT